MGKEQFLLFENATGYALFEVVEADEIASMKGKVQQSVGDLARFSKIIKLKAFQPFGSAEEALANINDISEGLCHDTLRSFLEHNLPTVKPGKKPKFTIGVIDAKIGQAIQGALSIPCNANETLAELGRGVRQHFQHFIKGLEEGGAERAQLGLAHSYSRAKVKFNVNKADNMIIQAIAMLDQLDKDLNTFSMRVKEWYSWHFPELAKIVKDNFLYARVATFIGDRTSLGEEKLDELSALVMDEDVAKQVLEASRSSMGMEMSDIDMLNVARFTKRIVSLGQYRQQLYDYLVSKMGVVAPNLAALIGEMVAARLISHAGSLTNLAKSPASTIQILGAEKALFRALKTKGNTPKYGLIFHSSFIGRASSKNKGRISRYLANKCAIASRIDSFAEFTTAKFGERMKDQVEQRLAFFETGEAPDKNIDVMRAALGEIGDITVDDDEEEEVSPKKAKKEKKEKKAGKKRSREEANAGAGADEDDEDGDAGVAAPPSAKKSSKKDKKEKKEKKEKKSKKKSK